jgi:hypothetical protein
MSGGWIGKNLTASTLPIFLPGKLSERLPSKELARRHQRMEAYGIKVFATSCGSCEQRIGRPGGPPTHKASLDASRTSRSERHYFLRHNIARKELSAICPFQVSICFTYLSYNSPVVSVNTFMTL